MISISLDYTMLIQLANFLLLLLALNYLLYKPILKILQERNELFDRLKSKADKAKAEMESGEAEKLRINAESLRQALQLKNALTAKGQEEEKSILAAAEEQATRQISENKAKLQQSLSAARTTLATETQTIAREMAEKILGRPL